MSAFARYPSLQDRAVLITGGATGIGETLVEAFAGQGAKVAFIDLAADEGAALAARLAGSSRHAPQFMAADLSQVEALRGSIAALRERTGPFSVLLNNAANDRRHAVEDTTPEFWDASVAVNIRHQFFTAQAVLPDMKALGGGSIVNFGSISWMLKQGGMPAYTASKAAVQGLTRCLARDVGPHRVRVNTLVPGWVMTEKQLKLWVTEETKQEIAKGQCIADPLMPQHIAAMALFLAADDSAMCTAQDFIVDGGWA
ncbi:SDR family NAD(P)-dependent oxidoreductase [Roseateles saccharophilus]|uniref:NAD(P)-dependent dehydrogenase (Short-subunit alcohol dehydrogenase family) n=1 Tax=Roseateles saccharophilus TaxID=304 RepID=A0A4R3UHQ1_ROSSA|nr:SDR family oxidoreductase [Roseateles saccharophilus]MDG0834825.1 SDR family oxidoreductase [Roseateles saccharophilus]TCU88948.1 NAD(P)-dependent dehydrogenase (short-subunit alcohol dehydrogenase family) [Roseateles saccharophilus]